MELKEKWRTNLELIKNSYPQSLMLPKDVEKLIDTTKENILRAITKNIDNDDIRKRIIRDVENELSISNNPTPINKIRTDYRALHFRFTKLSDTRKQDAWADLTDRIRYLIFRLFRASFLFL